MIYVYGVVERTTGSPPVPSVRGLDEHPVALRTIGGVEAAYTIHDRGSIPPTAQNVWLHEGVVEALMRDRAVLPARFGTTFRDEAALDLAIGSQADRLAVGLDRVRGCVELGLRMLWRLGEPQPEGPEFLTSALESEQAPADRSGRAYMMARLARERCSREAHHTIELLAAGIHAKLAALSRDSTLRVTSAPVPRVAAAYLVAREHADNFNVRVRQLAAQHPDLRLLCTGPWPPYHFVPELKLPARPEVQRA